MFHCGESYTCQKVSIPTIYNYHFVSGEKYDEGSNIHVIKSNRSEDKIDIAGKYFNPIALRMAKTL